MDLDRFKRIEEDCELSKFFNKVMAQIQVYRIVCAPKTFKEMREQADFAVPRFYELCLWEMWMHGVVKTLKDWDICLSEYIEDFSGSWKFYALSQRKEEILEYGGKEEDYNEDGSVKMDIPDDKLVPYTIIKKLVPDEWRDVVFDSTMDDLSSLPTSIQIASQFHGDDMLKEVFGKDITFYKKCEDGEIIPMSGIEKSMSKIIKEANGEELAYWMRGVIGIFTTVCMAVKSAFNPMEDNTLQLQALRNLVRNLLDFDDSLKDEIKKSFGIKLINSLAYWKWFVYLQHLS